jgi:hypothetical protein
VAAAVLAGAVISPPGRAVLDNLRESVGVRHAAPGLFSLPAPGRLLVVSAEGGGVWIVNDDGSKRRLGDYADAEWSPHGLFVVATKPNELLALEPDGTEHWSLARRDVSSPRWTGSRTDTRIAYCSASGLRVVAGDGTGDRLVNPRACGSAWRPGSRRVLTYADGTIVVAQDVDTGRILWRHEGAGSLGWSSDGTRLLVVAPHRVDVLGPAGKTVQTFRFRRNVLDAAFAPRSHAFAVHLRTGDGERAPSEVRLVAGRSSRRLFAATGAFGDIAWSPDGRWLLVNWPPANQWLFVPRAGTGRIRAVGNVAAQFPRPDDAPPMLLLAGRWCCPP